MAKEAQNKATLKKSGGKAELVSKSKKDVLQQADTKDIAKRLDKLPEEKRNLFFAQYSSQINLSLQRQVSLPDAEQAKKWTALHPSAPQIFFQEFQANSSHLRRMESRVGWYVLIDKNLIGVLGAVIAFVSIAGGIYLALEGKDRFVSIALVAAPALSGVAKIISSKFGRRRKA